MSFNACNLYFNYIDQNNVFCCYHFNFSDPSGAEHLPMDILASQNLADRVILSMDGNDPMALLTSRLCSYDMTRSQVTLMAQLRSDQHPILVCTKLVEPFQPSWAPSTLSLGNWNTRRVSLDLTQSFGCLGWRLTRVSPSLKLTFLPDW